MAVALVALAFAGAALAVEPITMTFTNRTTDVQGEQIANQPVLYWGTTVVLTNCMLTGFNGAPLVLAELDLPEVTLGVGTAESNMTYSAAVQAQAHTYLATITVPSNSVFLIETVLTDPYMQGRKMIYPHRAFRAEKPLGQ